LEPQNIYVKLPGDVADALIRLANREWRHPRERAGLFITDGLRRAGVLPLDVADYWEVSTDHTFGALAADDTLTTGSRMPEAAAR